MQPNRPPLPDLKLRDIAITEALVPQYLLAWAAEAGTRHHATSLEPHHILTALQALHRVEPTLSHLDQLVDYLRPGGPGWPPFALVRGRSLSRQPRVWDPAKLPLSRELGRVLKRDSLDLARMGARDFLTWAIIARSGRAPKWKEVTPALAAGLCSLQDPTAPAHRLLVIQDAATRLEQHVQTKVLGQGTAARAIGNAYARVAMMPRRKAPAILTFFGSPGTGKTLAARALAEGLAVLDPTTPWRYVEFSLAQSQSQALLGPYGPISKALLEQPNSIILLDEIEKAHTSFFMGLLPYLAGDPISDPGCPTVHTRDAWFVMTTNLGLEFMEDGGSGAFVEDPFEMLQHARSHRGRWDQDQAPVLPIEFVSRLAQGQAVQFRRPAAHHLLSLANRTPLL